MQARNILTKLSPNPVRTLARPEKLGLTYNSASQVADKRVFKSEDPLADQ